MFESENDENFLAFLQEIKEAKSIFVVNKMLFEFCNINYTFSSLNEVHEFYEFVLEARDNNSWVIARNKEWGDVQTPIFFIKEVFQIMKADGFIPDILIEPTMGLGNFIITAIEFYPKLELIYGVEIQKKYIWNFLKKLIRLKITKSEKIANSRTLIHIKHDDIFKHKFSILKDIKEKQKILIIGNPPWITNAELSVYQSNNLPIKKNIKNFSGLDALTGKSNFDITESIIVKLIELFRNHQGKIALLCKDIVIRNLIKEISDKKYPLTNIKAIKFSSQKIFKKTCNASLLIADLSCDSSDTHCSISLMNQPHKIIRRFGWINNKFVSNIERYQKYQKFDGVFPFSWRQGVKHDCSKVLELTINENKNLLKNKLGKNVDVEQEILFPLLKGSNLRNYEIENTNRRILLTQTKLSEDISNRLYQFPKFKEYLLNHQLYFNKRKSKIFRNKSDYAIFGIGDYTFTPYKVAIAAFYKKPIFTLVKPIEKKPVIFDDTCYFIGFDNERDAVILTYVLNSDLVLEYINSIAFIDSKRPYTKEILMRIDLFQIFNAFTFDDFIDVYKKISLSKKSEINYQEFQQRFRKIIEDRTNLISNEF